MMSRSRTVSLRRRDPLGGRMLAQYVDDREQRRQRLPEQRARRPGRLLLAPDRLEDVLLDLRPEARQGAQPLVARGRLQLGKRRDTQLLPDLPDGLRPETRDPEEVDDLGRDRLAPLAE